MAADRTNVTRLFTLINGGQTILSLAEAYATNRSVTFWGKEGGEATFRVEAMAKMRDGSHTLVLTCLTPGFGLNEGDKATLSDYTEHHTGRLYRKH